MPEAICTCQKDGSFQCQFPHPCRRCYAYQITWDTRRRVPDRNGSTAVHHKGTVVGVIPKGMLPYEIDREYRGVASTAMPRDHESYIVEENNKLYWPRISSLFAGAQYA